MMGEGWRKRFWVIAAFAVFFFATTAQVAYSSKIWPFDWLMFLPTFLGDVIALVFWLGAGPLVLAFIFLVPTDTSLFAVKNAMILTCLSAIINPISNLIIQLQEFSSPLQAKTVIINSVTMLGVAIPIFFFIVFVPQMFIKLLKRGN